MNSRRARRKSERLESNSVFVKHGAAFPAVTFTARSDERKMPKLSEKILQKRFLLLFLRKKLSYYRHSKEIFGNFYFAFFGKQKKTVARQFFSLGNRIVCNWLTSITGSPYSFASLRFRSFAFYTRLSNEQISFLPYSVL